jgi:iron complex transport system substrate-binding protein
MSKYIYLTFWCVIVCSSCNNSVQKHVAIQNQCQKKSSLQLKYARGFTIDYYDGFKVLTVRDLIDTSKTDLRYVLLPKGKPMPVGFENDCAIETPVTKVACISTPHIAELTKLGLADSIAAVTNADLIYTSEVDEKVKKNEIADIGAQEINYEKLVELHPAFVFTSGDFDGGDKMKLKLNSLGIKYVLNLEYKEQDPLARTEWLKFIAAFYDREQVADSIFGEIEKNYLSLKNKVTIAKEKPTAFCNMPFKEIWYMPCKGNYMTSLLNDAGSDYLWKDESAGAQLSLSFDYETVYNKAANADYWLNTGFASSLAEIKAADKKNAFFKAFKSGNVYNNNKRNTPAGGFDFWESGTVNPDKILADLIYIFHPDLLPGHELYYYQKLK